MKVTHIFFQLDGKVSPCTCFCLVARLFPFVAVCNPSMSQGCGCAQLLGVLGYPTLAGTSSLTHRISQLSLVATNPATFVSNLPFKLCFPWVFCGFFPVFSTVSLHCQHCAAKVNADIAAAAIARALEADEFVPWQFQRRPGRGTNQDFRLVTWEFMGIYI